MVAHIERAIAPPLTMAVFFAFAQFQPYKVPKRGNISGTLVFDFIRSLDITIINPERGDVVQLASAKFLHELHA